MSLLDTRKQFVQVSGRYDLVVDDVDWVDNGANFFINAGQLYLDQKIETKMSESVCYKKLVAGLIGCGFPDCRAVREVWLQDEVSQARTKLTKRDKGYIREKYKKPFGVLTTGAPLDYYLPTLRVYPDGILINQIESYIGWMDSQPSKGQNVYNGIIVMPPPDHEVVLEIVGLFYSPKFINDLDETLWSSRYPTVLLWAALRELEITYRNTEGAKDWSNAINERLVDIDKDNVEETIADVNQMVG